MHAEPPFAPPVHGGIAAATSPDKAHKLRELQRMRRLATGLLAAAFIIFLAASLAEPTWPAAAYIRAFAEAAVVGAVADWFAVVALFRHPLGLPIPHTAVVPRNHNRIAQSIGRFVAANFLASDAVGRRLEEMDVVGRLGRWLSSPTNVAVLAERSAWLAQPLMDHIREDQVRRTVYGAVRKGIDAVVTAPLVARLLSAAMERGYHQSLFDQVLSELSQFLNRNEGFIRQKVAAECGSWVPHIVEDILAERILSGIGASLKELRNPEHPWRQQFDSAAEDLVGRLRTSPDFLERAEATKAEMLASPDLEAYLDEMWSDVSARMAQGRTVRHAVEGALLSLGQRLESDHALRASVGHGMRVLVETALVPRRELIETFIAGMVLRWRTDTLVERLENSVGKDLQYVRINGTLVGGTVGLSIYLARELILRW